MSCGGVFGGCKLRTSRNQYLFSIVRYGVGGFYFFPLKTSSFFYTSFAVWISGFFSYFVVL